jgi:hypothetical protein
VIERARGKRWKRVRKLRTNSVGIFQGLIRGARKGSLRARLGAKGEASVPFSLKRVRDRPFNPFGSTT